MYNANISMLDDFIANYHLVGLTRQRLHELLGCEGLTISKVERMQIAGPNCTDLTQTFLEIEFSDWLEKNPLEQKTVRFRLVSEQHKVCGAGEEKSIPSEWYN